MRAKKSKENKRQLWKRMCSLLVAFALIVMSGPQQAAAAPTAGDTGAQPGALVIRSDELRGVWVSYLDWEQLPAERGSYQLAFVLQVITTPGNRCRRTVLSSSG